MWRLGHRKTTQVVIAARISILHDANHTVTSRACTARPKNRTFIEIHRAGRQGHECAVNHIDTAVFADADVVDQQTKQSIVDDRDLGITVGLQATRLYGRLHRLGGVGATIGADKNRARRRDNTRQLQEELVKLRLRHQCLAVRSGLGQAELLQLLVNALQQRLVTCNSLGIASMAGHPSHYLAALVKQLVGYVGIHQGGQSEIFGLDHIELATQHKGKVQTLAAVIHGELLPAAFIKRLGLGIHCERRSSSGVPQSAG